MKDLLKFYGDYTDATVQMQVLIRDAYYAHQVLDELDVPENDLLGNALSLTDRIAWLRCYIIFVRERTPKDQELYDLMKLRPHQYIPRKPFASDE